MTPDIALTLMLRGGFFALLLIFIVYGVIVGYHWFTYGTTQKTATTAMLVYIVGGALCFFVMMPAIF